MIPEIGPRGTAYGCFLLAHTLRLGGSQSFTTWVTTSEGLPTGAAAPARLGGHAELLLRTGLVEVDGAGRVTCSARLAASGDTPADGVLANITMLLLERANPTWLSTVIAPDGSWRMEALPGDVLDHLHSYVDDVDELVAGAASAALADDGYRKMLGSAGERAVVAAERAWLESGGYPDLAQKVDHVALRSDHYGYDVASYWPNGQRRLLEVKSKLRSATTSFRFFLSRHEAEVARRRRDWRIVAVLVDPSALDVDDPWNSGLATLVGEMRSSALLPLLPADGVESRWESASIRVSLSALGTVHEV